MCSSGGSASTRRRVQPSTSWRRASRRRGAPRERRSMVTRKTTGASADGSSTFSSRAAAVGYPRRHLRFRWGGPRARSLSAPTAWPPGPGGAGAWGGGGGVTVRRVKTGKQRSNAFDDIEYPVLHLAAVQAYGPHAQVEVTYLTSETIQPMEISSRKLETRREKLRSFLQAMQAGQFPAKPEARSCPRCPSFFLCGDLPGGA